ncbi:MAG: hypothetical protein BHV84_07150 [Prevotella sp. AG:487_50_53]|nr:MAG: hypothetical protein BHV84_07150 [Prevotella sp. AG:487_50_53]
MGHTGHSRHAGKAFRERGTGFLRLREGVFRHAGKVFWKAGTGFSARQEGLAHDGNESVCAFYTLQTPSRFMFLKKIM